MYVIKALTDRPMLMGCEPMPFCALTIVMLLPVAVSSMALTVISPCIVLWVTGVVILRRIAAYNEDWFSVMWGYFFPPKPKNLVTPELIKEDVERYLADLEQRRRASPPKKNTDAIAVRKLERIARESKCPCGCGKVI